MSSRFQTAWRITNFSTTGIRDFVAKIYQYVRTLTQEKEKRKQQDAPSGTIRWSAESTAYSKAEQTWDSFKPHSLLNHFKILLHTHTFCVRSPMHAEVQFWSLSPIHISGLAGRLGDGVAGKDFSPYPKLLESSTIHDLDFTGTALVLSQWSERKCQSLHLFHKFKERKTYDMNAHKVKCVLWKRGFVF